MIRGCIKVPMLLISQLFVHPSLWKDHDCSLGLGLKSIDSVEVENADDENKEGKM